MDPVAVLKTLWHHKIFVLPVLLLTAFAAVYIYSYAPRSYEARTTYAIVNPKTPSSAEIDRDPALAALNTDNPYLRSADSSLITQVIATRLNDVATGEALEKQGLSTDYTVERPSDAFLVEITAVSDDQSLAISTVRALGNRLEQDLRSIQTINGASDQYLFTSLVVAAPDKATEQFSSRLRSVIVVVIAGVVLTLGAVSLARAVEASRSRNRPANSDESGNNRKVRKRHSGQQESKPGVPNGTSDDDTLAHLETLVTRDLVPPEEDRLQDLMRPSSNGKPATKRSALQ